MTTKSSIVLFELVENFFSSIYIMHLQYLRNQIRHDFATNNIKYSLMFA